jgi:hypothetical protein
MTHSTTETSHTLANAAFMPKETQTVEVYEAGNEEPIAVYEEPVYIPQDVDEPVDEEPVADEPDEEEPPADEE